MVDLPALLAGYESLSARIRSLKGAASEAARLAQQEVALLVAGDELQLELARRHLDAEAGVESRARHR